MRGATVLAGLLTITLQPVAGPAQSTIPRHSAVVSRQEHADDAFWRCVGGPDEPVFEAEPAVAVNPLDPRNLVAAWMARGAKGGGVQVAASFDGGRVWSAPKTLPANDCADGPYWVLPHASDPWIAYGPEGRVYVAAQGVKEGDVPERATGIFVITSADGGRNWTGPATAALSLAVHRRFDNASIAADPKRAGVAYVGTTRYEFPELEGLGPGETPKRGPRSSYGPAAVSKTTDGGRTWTGARIASPLVEGDRVSAPQIVVDPAGDRVLVTYFRGPGASSKPGVVGGSVALIESADQGATWGPPQEVVSLVGVPLAHEAPYQEKPLNMAEDIVRIARDPRGGALAIVFSDGRFTGGRSLGVALTLSVDGGRKWSAPARLSAPDEPTAWLPTVAFNDAGQIGVVYLVADFQARRGLAFPVTLRLRVYERGGIASDQTSIREVRSEVLDRFAWSWPGDYLGLVSIGVAFHALYTRSTLGPDEPVAAQWPRGSNPTDLLFR